MTFSKRINNLLEALQISLDDWERYAATISLEDFQYDRDNRNMVLHAMLVTIQACIDIANNIISAKKIRKPTTYRETFEILIEAGIISVDLGTILADLASFRNVITPIYWRIDLVTAYQILAHNYGEIKQFHDIIHNYLNSSK